MQRRYYILFALIVLVYFTGMLCDVMAVDAAQYAEMSLEMLRTHSFLQIHALGADYLDKPPLLFWLNSISFYLLGAGNFSYKLPSLLFAILGIYSTYRFAALYYSRQTAVSAAIMLASTQALFLITNDVRTDTLLMGSVIFAIWRWAQYLETGRLKHMLWGCVGVGLALLSKGPIGVIVVGAAIVPHTLLKGKWRALFNWQIIWGLGIIALMLTPMCIGLYQQFGMKGLRFYFWTQSFGRITGESEWNNHPDTFFLMHTTAWAFMPWTLFLIGGWVSSLIAMMRSRVSMKEVISVSGFTLTLIALMLSKYQLPHYIFVVYPLGAVMAAAFYDELRSMATAYRIATIIQSLILVAIFMVAVILQYCFRGMDGWSLSCLIILSVSVLAMAFKKQSIFALSVLSIIAFNFLFSLFYFSDIMKYQVGGDFGRYVKFRRTKDTAFVSYKYLAGYEEAFYSHGPPAIDLWDIGHVNEMLNNKQKLIVITSPEGMNELKASGLKVNVVSERLAYKVSVLTVAFLNPATRESVCHKVYLLEVKK
jgi:4-amino-4-deoxy-L-arabinose transferase-like glycosyltransferase